MENCKGQRFGKLTLIRPNGTKYGKKAWLCQCDCGNFYTQALYLLKIGHIKSCGCGRFGSRKSNEYDLTGEYGIGYLNDGRFFQFDKEDYERIKEFKWIVNSDGYVLKANNCNESMHRFLMGYPKGMEVDHINHNKLDNRKSNLRICTHQQNVMNIERKKKSNSGHKGIFYSEKYNKYLAHIGYNKKLIHLGTFDTLEEALEVRKKAELEYFGEFANNN